MIFTTLSEINFVLIVLIFVFLFNADVVIRGCAWQATTIMGTRVCTSVKNHTATLLHALIDVLLLSLNF